MIVVIIIIVIIKELGLEYSTCYLGTDFVSCSGRGTSACRDLARTAPGQTPSEGTSI